MLVTALLPLVLPYQAQAPQNSVKETTRAVRFEYVSEKPMKLVTVAGSFNSWNNQANPMTLEADGRTWSLTLPIAFGRHQYKFVRDGEWIADPKAKSVDDGNGNVNSLLVVVPPDYKHPARKGDNEIATSTLRHEMRPPFLNYDRGKLQIMLEARPGDIKRISVLGSAGAREMKLVGEDEIIARYTAEIPWDRKKALTYYFHLDDRGGPNEGSRNGTPYLDPNGLTGYPTGYRIDPKTFVPFEVPAWVERGIMYQIFPDRFENGKTSNDPKDVELWNAEPKYFNRYGGDIAGVERRLDHLASLGVTNVYFNPIFQSPSNHRYDATDYMKVDPEFGTNEEFAGLVQAMRKHGMRTVLDFAFNHTATDASQFKDLIEKGPDSAYVKWYYPKSFPISVKENPPYEAWFGFPSMPKLNTVNPETKAHLFKVVDYWTQQVGIDGMRLDVGNEVDPNFWRAMRPYLKGIGQEKWILGEVWGDGSFWLGGDQWDSVMNYPFREASLGFFGPSRSKPSQYMTRLMANYSSYAPQVSRNLMNLLGSHDTPRILNLLNKDGQMARLAATMQFAWVGMPSVYYGDELGMEGEKDPDNRRGMRWDLATEKNPFLIRYRLLAEIRKNSPALQVGDPLPLVSNDDEGTLAFARLDPTSGDAALVAVNRSDEARTVTISVPAAARKIRMWSDPLSGRQLTVSGGKVIIPLPPKEAAILVPVSGSKGRLSAMARLPLAGDLNP